MRLAEFERLVRQLVRDIPHEHLAGIAAVEVSPKALPHPIHADVYTLGECVPIHGDRDDLVSRIVLHHGSFRALALRDDAFSWRDEAWETLTHELRHHVEWRADAAALEEYDWAAEQNFARLEGAPFDPSYHLAAESVAPHVYRIDDDVFVDRLVRRRPATVEVDWHGARYLVDVPAVPVPIFLTVDGVNEPPPGDLIVVLRRKPRLRDLFTGPRRASVARGAATRSDA